jgi:imidazolonepropionase-like amidohydrolase
MHRIPHPPHRTSCVPGRAVSGHLLLAGALLLVAGPTGAAGQSPPGAQASPREAVASDFAIRGVRLFDGEAFRGPATLIIREGRIASVGEEIALPAGLPVIDGAGRTLLPGLVDAHTHTFDRGTLAQALAFGVTLHLDMFTSPDFLGPARAEQEPGGAPHDRADILGAGYLATVGGGHGTQYGFEVPTVEAPEDAAAWVEARVREGADFVKIIIEDGSSHGMSLPSLDEPRVRALVRAAHGHGLLAVVHVSTLAQARMALDAGADGLVHLWVDRVPEPGFAEEMARAGMFVVPTLAVLEGMFGDVPGPGSAETLRGIPEAAPLLSASAWGNLQARFPPRTYFGWEGASESIRRLHAAGVPILAGSDLPNPGTTAGASVHRELQLLVLAGLSPAAALAAATSVPARAFRLEDRGRIVEGARADLLLVEGDPSADITATLRIVGAWKGGVPFDHAAARDRIARAVEAEAAAAGALARGDAEVVVSDFADGTLSVALGSMWSESTDALAGGGSTISLEAVDGALELTGAVAPGLPFAWAGAMWFPGDPPFSPRDLSGTGGFAFRLAGEGPGFQVSVFHAAGGVTPVNRPVELSPGDDGWTRVHFTWEELGVNPTGITGITLAAGTAPGAFRYRLGELVLLPRTPPERR